MRVSSSLLFLLGSISVSLASELIYLNPPTTFASGQLSPKEARVALARHLGLESFEAVGHELNINDDAYGIGKVDDFVGKGLGSAVVLSLNEEDAKEILPHYQHATFLTEMPFSPSLLSTYVDQASHIYETVASSSSPLPIHHDASRLLNIFELPATPASEAFQKEASVLNDFLEFGDATSEKFGAFQISSLAKVADQYGPDSEEYKLAKTTLAAIVGSLEHMTAKLAIIVSTKPSTASLNKRQPPQSPLPPPLPSPHEPISAISTCYSSEDTCEEETDSCSGHGSCVAATKVGRTCYVCACTSTKSDDGQGRIKTTKWAGNSCERKDVSSEFVLLAGTTVGLILFIFGSVALLVAAGEQKLPSVLTGGVVNSKKDN